VYTVWPFDSAEAQRRQQQTAADLQLPVEFSIDLGGGVPLVLELIPAGTSRIGSPTTESGYEGDEALRYVTFPTPFYMTKYQVTRAQFKAVLGVYPTDQDNEDVTGGGDNLPAMVWYHDADGWLIPAMNQLMPYGIVLRFPARDEWEHACRAGTETTWYTGSDEAALSRIGWYSGNSGNMVHPVGQKGANPWRLCDMVGNLWTWVTWTTVDLYSPHFVKGGAFNESAFGNGCRTGNLQMLTRARGLRLIASLPQGPVGVRAGQQNGAMAAKAGVGGKATSLHSTKSATYPAGVVYTILGRKSVDAGRTKCAPQLTIIEQRQLVAPSAQR
jgi:hypothetical protein